MAKRVYSDELAGHMEKANAAWAKATPDERRESRKQHAEAGWKICPHLDCPPWDCKRR
jgi:hypothetical protein